MTQPPSSHQLSLQTGANKRGEDISIICCRLARRTDISFPQNQMLFSKQPAAAEKGSMEGGRTKQSIDDGIDTAAGDEDPLPKRGRKSP